MYTIHAVGISKTVFSSHCIFMISILSLFGCPAITHQQKSPKIAENYHIFSFFGCPGGFFTPIELGMVSYISAKVHHHKNPSLSLIQEKKSF